MTTSIETPGSGGAPGGYVSWIGLTLGALALSIVMISTFAGPFAPQQSIGVTIGEIAADIAKGAFNGMNEKEQPAPEAAPWDIDRALLVAAAVSAVGAILLGIVGFVRGERRKLAGGAVFFGIGAILAQLFVWALMLILGVMLLIAIIQNFESIIDNVTSIFD